MLAGLPESIARHRILSTEETAKFIGHSIPHVRRLYRSGAMPAPIRLSARKLGWKIGVIIDWIDEKARAASSVK